MEGSPSTPLTDRRRRAASPGGASRRPRRAQSDAQAAEARLLVTELWRERPPQGAAPPRADGGSTVGDLQRALAALSVRADSLAAVASAGRPDEGTLLGQTARSIHAMLDLVAAGGAHDVLLRLARLERWLALRAQHEPEAQGAADLAMWALEHLESAGLP